MVAGLLVAVLASQSAFSAGRWTATGVAGGQASVGVFPTPPPLYPIPPECVAAGLTDFAPENVHIGGTGNDHITGGPGNDLIIGGEGNDHLSGGGGDDCIVGGPGNDKIAGEGGNDVIIGGEGNDNLAGDGGDDILFGGEGNDKLVGDAGFDSLNGGPGIDVCNPGNQPGDQVTACEGGSAP